MYYRPKHLTNPHLEVRFFSNSFAPRGKSRSFPDTTVEDLDDFGGSSVPDQSFAADYFNIINPASVSKLKGKKSDFTMPSSSPRIARKLLEDHDTNTSRIVNVSDIDMPKMNTSKNQCPEVELSDTINSSNKVEAALMVASNSSETQDNMLFLTNSSSSDENDDQIGNENNNSISGTIKTVPPSFTSPSKSQGYHHSSLSMHPIPMKTPGIGIPTPSIIKQRETSNGSYVEDYPSGANLPFPHPLRRIPDSPTPNDSNGISITKNISTHFGADDDDDDDDAFLPDDFEPNKSQKTFTEKEIDQMIKDAKRDERMTLKKQHDIEFDELQNDFDRIMLESGSQWKRDNDEEVCRYEKLLKEEKCKTSKKHHELIDKEQSLEDSKRALQETEREREAMRLRINELESETEKLNIVALEKKDSKIQETESLVKAKEEVDAKIIDLYRELNDNKSLIANLRECEVSSKSLIQKLSITERELVELREQKSVEDDQMIAVKQGQEAAKKNIADLSEQLHAQTESNNQSIDRLKEAQKEITNMKTQVAELSFKEIESSEGIILAKAENAQLKVLRVEDEKEIETLKVNISRMEEEHRAVYLSIEEEHRQAVFHTPQKNPNNNCSESPCYEIDILRIDNNKAKMQLKAMGKVLKRYKSERDETKLKMKELQQRQIQAIDNAVKQATLTPKEKIKLLIEENEALKQNLKDISEKILKEMKDKASDELESQIKSMNKIHEGEIGLVRKETSKEIESLKDELNQLKNDFDAKPSEADTKKSIKEIISKFEEDLKSVNEKAKVDTDRLQSEINSLIVVKDSAIDKTKVLESQIGEIHERNNSKIQNDKNEYENNIREIRDQHSKEGDEFLAQLDLIEAEANERNKKLESAVKEKDTVIAAMGSQIAESSQHNDTMKQKIASLQNNLETMKVENHASRQEISNLKAQHSKEIDDQTVLREKACDDAREEVIEMAQKQLDERNEYYKTIKKELDNSQSKSSVLETDLRLTKKEVEELSTRYEAREAGLKDELAQTKAQSATMEANLVRAEKVYRVELKQAKGAEAEMKAKFEESQATSQSVQKTLAALVAEKEKISQELAEVTILSEEFASLLEEKDKLAIK